MDTPCEFTPGEVAVALADGVGAEDEWGGRGWDEMVKYHQAVNRMGWRTEILDAKAVKEMAPLINPNLAGGIYDPDGGHANPQRTVQAYAWAIQDHGGRIHQRTEATGFKFSGGKVTAVQTTRGLIAAAFVVCATGPQTSVMAEMAGAFVPVAPGRVEIIVTAPLPPMYQGAIEGHGLYGRQTRRGNLAYGGGGQEWVDVDDTKTPEKPNTPLIRHIGRRVMELFSGADDVPIIRSWSCVVEVTPDGKPIIDVLDDPGNMLFATASSDGFGLSPVHGEVISELVMHGETTLPIDGYRLSRFANLPVSWREDWGWTPGN